MFVRGHHVYSSLPSHFCFLCVWEFIILHKDRYFCFDSVKKKCINIFFLTLSLSISFFLCCSNNLLVFFLSFIIFVLLFLYKYICTYFWFYANVYFIVRYVKYMQMVNDSFYVSWLYLAFPFLYILYYYICKSPSLFFLVVVVLFL